jgi:hypothetical protein
MRIADAGQQDGAQPAAMLRERSRPIDTMGQWLAWPLRRIVSRHDYKDSCR